MQKTNLFRLLSFIFLFAILLAWIAVPAQAAQPVFHTTGLDIPGAEALAATPAPETQAPVDENTPLWLLKFRRDPVGNGLAIAVLAAMVISVLVIGYLYINPPEWKGWSLPGWVIPVLCLLGIFVAGYLTFVEVANATPVCGPVGDCASVQTSPYSKVLGVLPVGILGLAGYIAILAAWLLQRFGPASLNRLMTLAMWGFALFGVLFSIYLTFLEPFVIGATCIWCISSAILITLLLWAASGPALKQLNAEEDLEAEEA